MSLQSELTRLQANVTSISSSKDDIMAALVSKGVTVPAGATLHDVPNLIGQIDGMAPAISTTTIGGRTYKTVRIGSQWWLAENLDYTWDGLKVGYSTSANEQRANYYNNDSATYGVNGNKYGLLYNWIAVKYLEDNKDSLIPGWHVSTTLEWDALTEHVGGAATAGTKLKSTSGWSSGNGDDSYGFNGLPAGYYYDSKFYHVGEVLRYWTSGEKDSNDAFARLFSTGTGVEPDYSMKSRCYSIRLVKDVS